MDSRALVAVFVFCAVLAVGEGVKCYACTRLKWTLFRGGDDYEKCKHPVEDGAPTKDDCDACAYDTRDNIFDWIGRHCIKGDTCTNGTFSQEHPTFEWVDKIPFVDKEANNFDAERTCCTTDLCNGIDGASSLHVTSGLLAAILIPLYINFRQ